MCRICDVIVEGGLIALMVFAPLAFGAIPPVAYSVLEAGVAVLAIVWIARSLLGGAAAPTPAGRLLVVLPFAGFVLLVFLQWARLGGLLPGTACGYSTRIELCKVLSYLMAFVLVVWNISRRDQIRRVVATVVGVGVAMSILGVSQMVGMKGGVRWYWDFAPGNRAFGPYVGHNQFAGCLLMAIPFAMASVLHSLGGRRSEEGGGKAARIGRALPKVAAVVMIAALLLSRSKPGVAAFLVSCVFLLGALLPGASGRRRAALRLFLIAAVCALGLWGVLWLGFGRHALVSETRFTVWGDTLRMWRDAPIFGTGLGTFATVFPACKSPSLGPLPWAMAGSEPLQLLAEAGLAGFALMAVFLVVWWVQAARALRVMEDEWSRGALLAAMASAAGILAYGIIESGFHAPANCFSLAVILGLGWSLGESVLCGRESANAANGEE